MKEIMFNSISGNTKKLALTIKEVLGDVYCGDIKEVESDVVFVGFWATKNSCDPKVQALLESLNNKKVFLFGTCGYNNSQEFFDLVLDNAKAHINDTNEFIGGFVCQGKVSDAKQKSLKETHPNYEGLKPFLEESVNHPSVDDLDALKKLVSSL
ncbi:MAG: flavodoxin family protein [bacterium]